MFKPTPKKTGFLAKILSLFHIGSDEHKSTSSEQFESDRLAQAEQDAYQKSAQQANASHATFSSNKTTSSNASKRTKPEMRPSETRKTSTLDTTKSTTSAPTEKKSSLDEKLANLRALSAQTFKTNHSSTDKTSDKNYGVKNNSSASSPNVHSQTWNHHSSTQNTYTSAETGLGRTPSESFDAAPLDPVSMNSSPIPPLSPAPSFSPSTPREEKMLDVEQTGWAVRPMSEENLSTTLDSSASMINEPSSQPRDVKTSVDLQANVEPPKPFPQSKLSTLSQVGDAGTKTNDTNLHSSTASVDKTRTERPKDDMLTRIQSKNSVNSSSSDSLEVFVIGFEGNEMRLIDGLVRLSKRRTPHLTLVSKQNAVSAKIFVIDAKDEEALHWANHQSWLKDKVVIWVDGDSNKLSHGHVVIHRPVQWTNLPSLLAQTLEEQSHAAESKSNEPERKLSSGKNILVVDDSLTARDQIKSLLEKHHLLVRTAESGEEAIEAVKQKSFDLILMDVVMPGMDGYDAIRNIRAMLPPEQMPALVMLTGKSSPFDRIRGKMAGCDVYLTKPITEATLQETLKQFIRL